MELYSVLTYIHILLFVFWLGGDMGVFLNSQFVKKPELSFETRSTLLKVALVLDMLPRTCFVLMLPVGTYLAQLNGIISFGAPGFVAMWAITIIWMGLTWGIPAQEGKPLGATLRKINFGFLLLMGLGFCGLAVMSMITGGPFDQGWFIAKMFVFGLIFFCAIMIDVAIGPMIGPFMALETEGSTPERERVITGAMNHTISWVLALYVCLAVIGFLGVVKPF